MHTRLGPIIMASLVRGNFSLLIVAALIISAACFVLWKKPRSRVNQAFFAFALGGGLWVGGIALLSTTGDFGFDRLVDYGGVLFIVGFFLLAWALPVAMRFRIHPLFLFSPVIIEALTIIPMGLVNSGMTVGADGSLSPIPGPYILPHSLLGAAYTLFGVAILIYKYRHATGIEQLRIGYLALGTGIFAAAGVVFDALLPAFGVSSFNLIGPLAALVFVGLIAYSIVRHELLEIKVIIQRGLIYTVLFGGGAAVYLAVLDMVGLFADKTSNVALLMTGGITIVAGVFSVPILDRQLRKATDRLFFKDRYDYAEALHRLSAVVYTAKTFDDLVSRTEDTLRDILKNSSVRVVFLDDGLVGKPPFDMPVGTTRADAEDGHEAALPYMSMLRVPISVEGREIGSIVCGPKLSGDRYTPSDVKLLQTFAYQAATALGRARLFGELRRYAGTLEQRVAERTAELRKAQENQRRMMIDVSHNLQTPLAVFQTRLDEMKALMPDQGSIPALEGSLRDLSAFIDSLLRLARLENDTVPPEKSRIDLSALVGDIADEMRTIAGMDGVRVRSAVADGISIDGNAREIREAFMNIASNALKYLGGGRSVSVSLANEQDGQSVVFSIADTGMGISPEERAHIFERFYRVRRPGSPSGTGLGLAITKQIVLNHGGEIWCESTEGTGSTFYIRLPIR